MTTSAQTKARGARPAAVDAWIRLLRCYAAATRGLNAKLVREHGLTVNDYEALLALADAGDEPTRRTDLAQKLGLTASGVTRLLEGLEGGGLVEKAACPTDARVSYVVLTEAGRAKLDEASCSQVAVIEELFEAFSREDLETLAELLGRLPGTRRVGRPLAA